MTCSVTFALSVSSMRAHVSQPMFAVLIWLGANRLLSMAILLLEAAHPMKPPFPKEFSPSKPASNLQLRNKTLEPLPTLEMKPPFFVSPL